MSSEVVLITGALSGIGRATALAFAQEGARLVVSGRSDDVGHKLVAEIRARDAEAEYVLADVRSEDDVRRLVDLAVARFGRLDVAVNSAGSEGQPGPVTSQTRESMATVFDVNVLGVLLCMKHELRVMLPQGSGSILNISSTLGRHGVAGASVYSASKHAVEGLTKCAALEVASFGIRVNAIAPGPIDTDMMRRFAESEANKAAFAAGVPIGRLGQPEEIAEAIMFLTSAKASFITGASIPVDGGMSSQDGAETR